LPVLLVWRPIFRADSCSVALGSGTMGEAALVEGGTGGTVVRARVHLS
jgi:hypothetical protein